MSTGTRRSAWIPALMVSGAAAMLAVRLNTPLTLDLPLVSILLFFLLPGLLALLLGRIRPGIGAVVRSLGVVFKNDSETIWTGNIAGR